MAASSIAMSAMRMLSDGQPTEGAGGGENGAGRERFMAPNESG